MFKVKRTVSLTLYANDNGPGKTDGFNTSNVQPGETIYFKIYAPYADSSANPYSFNFTIH